MQAAEYGDGADGILIRRNERFAALGDSDGDSTDDILARHLDRRCHRHPRRNDGGACRFAGVHGASCSRKEAC